MYDARSILDEIEWLVDRNPFADNLPADITVNDLLEKLESAVSAPAARNKVAELKNALAGAYKGDGACAPGEIPYGSEQALSLVRSHMQEVRDLVSKSE